jgi:transforming growth factor-beta-induced protein
VKFPFVSLPLAYSSLAAAVAVAVSFIGSTAVAQAVGKDIPSTAIDAGSFTTLVAALSAASLMSALSEPNGPFTVFAPTEDAFDALPNGLVECLLLEENKSALTSILTYHVVNGEVLFTNLSNGTMSSTLQGEDIMVDLSDDVKINDSTVISADILASNGVIHVIDSVLVPPSIDVAVFLSTCGDGDEPEPETTVITLVDIPSTAIATGIFDTLVTALDVAGLVGAISEPNGPYTVFAPTDDAFDALPAGLVTCLLKDQNKGVLMDILSYHIASGRVLSTDLLDGMVVRTLLGVLDVTIDLTSSDDGSVVKINDSTVVTADVLTTNGVIHIINSVLVPPSIDVAAFL